MRIERQQVLGEQHNEERYKQHQVDEQHGTGIAPPPHPIFRFHAADAVDRPFAGGQYGRQEGSLPLEDPGHVGSREGEQA